ncbi:conserved hypothetical protein [Enterobacterales bacterium 8AC]|nr:conserved hypothetical protein [Enterobacterales bacterium 8AC]
MKAVTVLSTARRLRSSMTEAEKTLWLQLRDRRFTGFKFRRQCPIGPYFADFLCWQARLIIELDGGQHVEQVVYDRQRTRFLEQQGFTVIRFWNDEIFQNWEGVAQIILQHLQSRPSPQPSPRGRGGKGR